jgi:aminoglycoside phosphotransferase (APT) family kinase protein
MTSDGQTMSATGRKSIAVTHSEVRRPYNDWSLEVHNLLDFIASNGFSSAPQCLRVEDDAQGNKWEIMSVVAGDTFDFPLQGAIATTSALESAATLLKQFHLASRRYLDTLQQRKDWASIQWMLPARQPVELICHGDFSPYNLALSANIVTGVFDFDTAHPGPAIWDVAYAVYCFAPFKTDKNDQMGDLSQQIQRARCFCDAYDLSHQDRNLLVVTMIERVQSLIDFMQSDRGSEYGTAEHLQAYINDVGYLHQHREVITSGLVNDFTLSR